VYARTSGFVSKGVTVSNAAADASHECDVPASDLLPSNANTLQNDLEGLFYCKLDSVMFRFCVVRKLLDRYV